jgi:Cdc6-like AAA superfamily ATPase
VQRWWGHLTEEWTEVRRHAYLPFRGPGREEIVDDCLGRLRDLNKGMLRGRNNCCVLGPKDIGKTCVLKALVCLNSVLSSNTLSIFLDGRTIEHRLSELIVRGLEARYPPLMEKVSATLKTGWDKDLSFVVKVLQVIKGRVFVVLDEKSTRCSSGKSRDVCFASSCNSAKTRRLSSCTSPRQARGHTFS